MYQGSDFVSKAIDIAANEILAVATTGQGMLLYSLTSILRLDHHL